MRNRWMLVSLLSAVATTTTAAAQSTSPRLGIFGGINQAHVDGDNLSDISNRSAGAFGLYVVKPLAPSWSFQLGGMYTMKGWRRVEPDTHDEAMVKLDYIEVPALLRFDFGAPASTGAFLFAGPGFGFRSGCELTASSGSSGASGSASCADVERLGGVKFKSFDVGAILGAGVRVPFGRQQLVLSAQYEHGLTNVNDDRNTKNRVFTFGAGIEVPFRR
jgi:hypothetical protein